MNDLQQRHVLSLRRNVLNLSPFRGIGDLHILLLIFITAVLYCRSLGNEFLMLWDDQWMVFNTYTDNGLTWENIRRIFSEFYFGQYSPLNQICYTLLYYIAGYNPIVYHAFCILLHVCNVILAYLFLNALLSAMQQNHSSLPLMSLKGEIPDRGMTANAAFFGTLLFAVHPVNVESVSWISASKIVLCSFNYLLGLYLYVRFLGNRSRMTYLAVLLLFILAFAAKEQAVSFVLSCMVIDYAVRRKERLASLFLEKLPMILLALFFGIITMMTHWHSGAGYMPQYSGIGDRIVLGSYSLFEYIIKSLLPCNLFYVYPFPYQPEEGIPFRMWIFPVLVCVGGCILLYFRRNRLLLFAVLFFLVNLVLMLHIIPMSRFTVTSDRYLYVALLGPAALAGSWVAWGLRRHRTVTLSIFVPYLLFLCAYTFNYQGRWESSVDLKRDIRNLLKERKREVDYDPYLHNIRNNQLNL